MNITYILYNYYMTELLGNTLNVVSCSVSLIGIKFTNHRC